MKEIEVHVQALATLKAQINRASPVSSLPAELLTDIFEMMIEEYYRHHHRPSTTLCAPFRWVRLAHVCRQWRIAVFGSPILWRRLVVENRRSVDMGLKLSRSTPLTVTVHIPMSKLSRTDLLDKVLAHSWRLKELTVIIPWTLISTTESLYRARGDVLEELCLYNCDFRQLLSSQAGSLVPLRSGMFSGETPRLRLLHIHRVLVAWDHSLFCSSVTHLSVVCREEWTRRVGEFETLLNALDRMSGLRELHIDGGIPNVRGD